MKPKVKLHIDIPEPCNKGWDNMVPNSGGRYCDSCEKTVIDFTAMTDAELVRFFIDAKGKPFCGHYLQSQINREIVYQKPAKSIFNIALIKKIAAGLLLFQSMVTDSWAQVKTITQTTQSPTTPAKEKARMLHGRLRDFNSKFGIPNVRMAIKGMKDWDTTDIEGYFSLPLHDIQPGDIILTAHYNDKNDRVPGTSIRNIPFTESDIVAGKQIDVYRFDTAKLNEPEVNIVQYNAPIIDGAYGGLRTTITGDYIEPMPVRCTTTKKRGWFLRRWFQ